MVNRFHTLSTSQEGVLEVRKALAQEAQNMITGGTIEGKTVGKERKL